MLVCYNLIFCFNEIEKALENLLLWECNHLTVNSGIGNHELYKNKFLAFHNFVSAVDRLH